MQIKRILEQKTDGMQVKAAGWVRSIRAGGSFGFLEMNDGSCFQNLQVVLAKETLQNFSELSKLNIGSAVRVTGELVLTPTARQPMELKAEVVEIVGPSRPDYPLQKKRHSFEYLRTIGHLRARTNTFSAVFRVRSVAAQAIHRFFHARGFLYVHTPIITASDAEGAGQMFRVTTLDPTKGDVDYRQDFFGKSTHLTVSGQLEGETFAQAFGNIYTFGPTFRAENSNTARHAAEFWMIEPEMAFADLREDMQLAEDMLKYVIDAVLRECPADMDFLNERIDNGLLERLQGVLHSAFGQISYTEAVAALEQYNDRFSYRVHWGCDLQTEHERFLTEELYRRPVFVTDYPKEIKAFYMRQNEDGKTVAAMDLLVPGVGEMIGGSQREEREPLLLRRMQELGMRKEDYDWYVDLRRYGSTPHAGFGLGFERAIMYFTGMKNIRDVIPYPRTVGAAEF